MNNQLAPNLLKKKFNFFLTMQKVELHLVKLEF